MNERTERGIKKMKLTNLSREPLGKLHSWLPHDLQAEQVVFLPDACPGKSPLPTGTAVLTRQADWRKSAVSGRGVKWAADNRAAINEKLDLVFGATEVLLDLPHNTFEQLEDGGVIIRK